MLCESCPHIIKSQIDWSSAREMSQPVRFYFDFINQSCRALYIFLEAAKIPFEPIPISVLKGEHLTGEYRDKVNRFKNVPAITEDNFQLAEGVAIFRHLSREKLVPEHWYPRRKYGRSRIDEFLEWQQKNMGIVCTDYFQEKWLLPYLQKSRSNESAVNNVSKRLDQTLNDFENLFLKSKKFMIGENISYADLVAICEIDQPKCLGFNPFKNRVKLTRWYDAVRDELGPHYKDVVTQFENTLKVTEKPNAESISVQQ